MAIKGKAFSTAHKESLSRSWAHTKEFRRVALRRGWEKRRLEHGPIVPMAKKEINHRYGQRHKNRLRERLRSYRKANPHIISAQNRRNKARRRGAKGTFTPAEWALLVALFAFRCAYCWRAGLKLEADHVIPVSKDGTNFIENILPACRSCNSRKSNTIPPWLATLKFVPPD